MVEWKKLGEISEIGTGSNNREDACDNGCYPFYVRSQEVLKIDSYLYDEEAILIPGEGGIGEIFHYVNGKYGLHQRTYRVHPVTDEVKGRYIYYYLFANFKTYINTKSYKSTAASIRKPMLLDFPFPIPSLEEQTRIVGILDTFTSAIDNLKEQIAQRRKQYEYYRDQLLDLEGKEGVEMKYLLDVLAQPVTDGPHETPSFYEDGIPFISADAIVDNKINFSRKRGYISEEYDLLCQKKYKPQLNDIYLVKSGSTTGKVAIVRTDERFNIWSPLAAIRVNQRNHPYFVYYMLQTKKVQDQVKLKSSQGSQPNLSMRVLEKFIIPVPPLSDQQRIVSILDTFEASIQNLEAQLSQREKQYEYYRNKLLTFE